MEITFAQIALIRSSLGHCRGPMGANVSHSYRSQLLRVLAVVEYIGSPFLWMLLGDARMVDLEILRIDPERGSGIRSIRWSEGSIIFLFFKKDPEREMGPC